METVVSKKSAGIKDLFPHKAYMTLLIGNFISRFGDSLDAIAYGWMVYILTGSKLLMGTLFAVNFIPNIVLAPFAGVIADHFPKKTISIIGDFGRGLIVSLTALLFFMGKLHVWHLYMFTLINSTFETFVMPARSSLMPHIIPKELYMTASSFSSSVSSTAQLLGAAASGAIIGLTGISGAIFIDALTFLISGALLLSIKLAGDTKSQNILTAKAYFTNFKEGLKFIKGNIILKYIIIIGPIVNFSLSPLSILRPVYVKEILKSGPECLSLLGTMSSLGMILGGLFVGQFCSRFKKSHLIAAGFSGIGIAYMLTSLPGALNLRYDFSLLLACFCFFMLVFFVPVVTSPISSIMMTSTPRELLGRTSSVMNMMMLSSVPAGSAITGVISEHISIPILFLIMGLLLSSTALILFIRKDFRSV